MRRRAPVLDSMGRSNGSRLRLLGKVIDGRACSGLLRAGAPHHQRAGDADRAGAFLQARRTPQAIKDGIGELTAADFARAIPQRLRDRLVLGDLQTGEDVAALRRFTGLSQAALAWALGISVHTLRNWEQGRRMPEGPALALLRTVVRHPRVLRENVALAGWQDGRESCADRRTAAVSPTV